VLSIERDGDVFVLTMGEDENRFHPDSLGALEGALDEVELSEGPAAMVVTGKGKHFSTGLDLDWMGAAPQEEAKQHAERMMRLLGRVLTFPVATVAAINGHCFAAGAMLSLACDSRLMRADRGFWCLPEVDLKMAFPPGMAALITSRLSARTAQEAMLTGRRYGGHEAHEAGIVQQTAAEQGVLPHAIERVALQAGKDRATVAQIKRALYGPVVEKLRRPLFAQLGEDE